MPVYSIAGDGNERFVEAPSMVAAIAAWQRYYETDDEPEVVALADDEPVIRGGAVQAEPNTVEGQA